MLHIHPLKLHSLTGLFAVGLSILINLLLIDTDKVNLIYEDDHDNNTLLCNF